MSIKSLKADCYRLFQETVINRDILCQKPGCNAVATSGHHVFPRNRMGTAFLPEAGIGLCCRHHVDWAHGEPEHFRKFMVSRLGKEDFGRLERVSRKICRYREGDLVKIREGLKCGRSS